MRQGAREDIPAYNRRFAKAADLAHPLPCNADVEEALTELYMVSLKDGKIKDRVFAADPRLVVLLPTQTLAAEEWARQRRRSRIQRESKTVHEPMDVSTAEPI